MEQQLSVEQIDHCLKELELMADKKRRLIAEHQAIIDADPIKWPTKTSVGISEKQFNKLPIKFFWTREGKSAKYFQFTLPKVCLLCESYSAIEIEDKYSKIQLCELHGLKIAQKLELRVAGLPSTSKTGVKTRQVMSNARIDAMIAVLEKERDKRITFKLEKEDNDDE